MSLTSQIKDPKSPVARWMAEHLDAAAVARLVTMCNEQLRVRTPQSIEGTDVQLVGRAFDYAFRWQFGGIHPNAAMMGAKLCAQAANLLERPAWTPPRLLSRTGGGGDARDEAEHALAGLLRIQLV